MSAELASRRPVKIGWWLPPGEAPLGCGESTARWSDYKRIAIQTENAGFDSLWFPDHFSVALRDIGEVGFWECWSIISAVAAVTKRVEIGALVACTAFRNPALLAKIADTVDEISNGRLILGLGGGWEEREFVAAGYPFDHITSRFEEAIEIIARLLKGEQVTFAGSYYSADTCELRPRGPRPHGPPIMIGSSSPRMLQALAKHGDSWNGWAVQSLEELAEHRRKVDTAMELAGRDPATVDRTVAIVVSTPLQVGRPSISDSLAFEARAPAELAELLLAYSVAGVSHVQLVTDPANEAGIEWTAEVLKLLDAS